VPRDVARYILAILVPLRLFLALPAAPANVIVNHFTQAVDQRHGKSSHFQSGLSTATIQAPASAIGFESSEFSEAEDFSDLIVLDGVSYFDTRPSEVCRPECRISVEVRLPSRTFPLRC